MLEHSSDHDISVIEDFVDDEYQRLLVGYYIHNGDAYNADRILNDLSLTNEVNIDFATIQEVNLKRLFPAFYNIPNYYSPTSNELQAIRTIAEKFSENTGYASALYYLYTHEKVYPDFDFSDTKPRNSNSDSKDLLWFDFYPNPTDGSIQLTSNREISEYALYDSYGRLQARGLVKNLKTLTLDISNYSRGIYLLNVKCESEIITKKIVKI